VERINAITQAINRYEVAEKEIPKEWIEELEILILKEYLLSQKP
jgi:hypothetical protein